MIFWKKHNYRDIKQINGCQGKALGVTFSTKGHQEILRGDGTVLCPVCGGNYIAMCVFSRTDRTIHEKE